MKVLERKAREQEKDNRMLERLREEHDDRKRDKTNVEKNIEIVHDDDEVPENNLIKEGFGKQEEP